MKKIILTTALCLSAICGSAEIAYRSLDNKGATNIVLTDSDAPAHVEVTDAVLTNDGTDYPARQIRCDVKDGTATYRLQFKKLTLFKDCRLTITVNGEKKTLDIQKSLTQR